MFWPSRKSKGGPEMSETNGVIFVDKNVVAYNIFQTISPVQFKCSLYDS